MAVADADAELERGSTLWAGALLGGGCGALALALVGVGVVVLLGMPSMREVRAQAERERCADTLRQLGLAALMYSSDHRAYPHVGPLDRLDGDAGTSDTPRTLRALVNLAYHGSDTFVCPASDDQAAPSMGYSESWAWGGAVRLDPTASPFTDGERDPVLRGTRELSYGWTRRGLTSNTNGGAVLGADRSLRDPDPDVSPAQPGLVGNHEGGFTEVLADGSTGWVELAEGDPRFADLADEQGEALSVILGVE